MPFGLDGNPNPVRTAARRAVVATVAAQIQARMTAGVTLVAVDGIDGAGKSTFADELAAELRARQLPVIRSSVDSFHNPRARRWRLGRTSPEGFYRESHDLDALREQLLDPLAAGAGAQFRGAVFDEPSDAPVDAPLETAPAGSVLVFDGIFLHRPELRGYWDFSIFLDGERRVTEGRIGRAVADCPASGPDALWHLLRWWARLDRYVTGQRLYFAECDPRACADVIVDNNDLEAPFII